MDGQFFPGQAIQFEGGPRGRPFIDSGTYRANAVAFNGSTRLTRGAGFTGAADSKKLTISAWVRKQTVDGVNYRILTSDNSVAFLQFYIGAGNKLTLTAPNAAGTNVVVMTAAADYLAADGWVHSLISFDLSDTGKRHYYRNDALQSPTWGTYSNDDMDFTLPDWALGALVGGGQIRAMDMADIQVWFGTYVDLSVEDNRRLFISSTGKPVFPALARTALGEPTILLHGIGSGYRQWHENKGSGGGFTVAASALADASSSPSD